MPVAEVIDWYKIVKGKWLLWDACGLNRVLKYDAESIFKELADLDVINVYINPTQLKRKSRWLVKYRSPSGQSLSQGQATFI